ncbi:MAG: hypothetical protein RsTaC01_0169 [Candidatus Paraimprobicoccus trichonymphae]|uniref:Uncharacterized protein n=1 Tax=Candidatus Paraimprobicoccus trichonymphae TaxID=3033793 RepID=A0AA48KVZ2_9FIRM|nr:MAG: hypothetical protein RsTaC01_0169 [Candidatus Paraimprobicoccus trichonymphae]
MDLKSIIVNNLTAVSLGVGVFGTFLGTGSFIYSLVHNHDNFSPLTFTKITIGDKEINTNCMGRNETDVNISLSGENIKIDKFSKFLIVNFNGSNPSIQILDINNKLIVTALHNKEKNKFYILSGAKFKNVIVKEKIEIVVTGVGSIEKPPVCDHNSINESISSLKNQIKEMSTSLKTEITEISKENMQEQLTKFQTEFDKKIEKISLLKKQVEEMSTSLKTEITEISKENMQEQLTKFQTEFDKKIEKISLLKKQVEEMSTSLKTEITEISKENMQEQLTKFQTEFDKKIEKISLLEKQVEEMSTSLKTEITEISKENMQEQLTKFQTEFDKKIEKISLLENQLKSISSGMSLLEKFDFVKLSDENIILNNSIGFVISNNRVLLSKEKPKATSIYFFYNKTKIVPNEYIFNDFEYEILQNNKGVFMRNKADCENFFYLPSIINFEKIEKGNISIKLGSDKLEFIIKASVGKNLVSPELLHDILNFNS